MTGPYRMTGPNPDEGDPVLVPGDPAIPPAPEEQPEQIPGEDTESEDEPDEDE